MVEASEQRDGILKDGILYTVVRLLLGYLSWPRYLFRCFSWLLKLVKPLNTKATDGIIVELWVILWLLIIYFGVLPQLDKLRIPQLLVVFLALVLLARLTEILHFFFEHYVDRRPDPRSVGRAVVLAGANFVEVGLIFGGLVVANIRLGTGVQLSDIPPRSEVLKASFSALLSLNFNLPVAGAPLISNDCLSLAAIAVGLLIVGVVLAQLVSAVGQSS